jgi:hypothetical protein
LPLVLEPLPAVGRFGFVLAGGLLGPLLAETPAGFERTEGAIAGGRLEPLVGLLGLEPEE